MTDRELLELAAKAAGMPEAMLGTCPFEAMAGLRYWDDVEDRSRFWNPIVDDADAFRLAVALELRVQKNRRAAIASGRHGTTSEKIMNGDPLAATRRAIVRAAAAIGGAQP